jgi:hypothetical protein
MVLDRNLVMLKYNLDSSKVMHWEIFMLNCLPFYVLATMLFSAWR